MLKGCRLPLFIILFPHTHTDSYVPQYVQGLIINFIIQIQAIKNMNSKTKKRRPLSVSFSWWWRWKTYIKKQSNRKKQEKELQEKLQWWQRVALEHCYCNHVMLHTNTYARLDMCAHHIGCKIIRTIMIIIHMTNHAVIGNTGVFMPSIISTPAWVFVLSCFASAMIFFLQLRNW